MDLNSPKKSKKKAPPETRDLFPAHLQRLGHPEIHDLVAEFLLRGMREPELWDPDVYQEYMTSTAEISIKKPEGLNAVAEALAASGLSPERLAELSMPGDVPMLVARSWAAQFGSNCRAGIEDGVRYADLHKEFSKLVKNLDPLLNQMKLMKPAHVNYLWRAFSHHKYVGTPWMTGEIVADGLTPLKEVIFGTGPEQSRTFSSDLLLALNCLKEEASSRAERYHGVDRGGGNQGGHRGTKDPAGDGAFFALASCLRSTFLALEETEERLETIIPSLMCDVAMAAGVLGRVDRIPLLDRCVTRYKAACDREKNMNDFIVEIHPP